MRCGHWRYSFFTVFLLKGTLILLTEFFTICVEYDYALWICDVRSIWRNSLYWYCTILSLELGIAKSAPISSKLWPEIMHTIIIAYCLLSIFGRIHYSVLTLCCWSILLWQRQRGAWRLGAGTETIGYSELEQMGCGAWRPDAGVWGVS